MHETCSVETSQLCERFPVQLHCCKAKDCSVISRGCQRVLVRLLIVIVDLGLKTKPEKCGLFKSLPAMSSTTAFLKMEMQS